MLKKIKQKIKKSEKIKSYIQHDDFVVEQFKENPEFLKISLEKSFANYVETGDKSYFLYVLQQAAKSRGVSKVAKESGLSRQYLYEIFSEKSNPTLENFGLVLKSLGLKMQLESI
jgi:hypothetical protein